MSLQSSAWTSLSMARLTVERLECLHTIIGGGGSSLNAWSEYQSHFVRFFVLSRSSRAVSHVKGV